MGANAYGKTSGHWLAFDHGDYLTTNIVLGIAVVGSIVSTQAPTPFSRRNARFISATALIVGIGGMLVQLARAFADNAIYGTGRLPHPAALPVQRSLAQCHLSSCS